MVRRCAPCTSATPACCSLPGRPNKAAEPIAKQLLAIFKALPPRLRHTVTFDNGTEFARHHALHWLHLQTFLCDPYSPWQKGGIENAIGRIRRFIPRNTDLATLD